MNFGFTENKEEKQLVLCICKIRYLSIVKSFYRLEKSHILMKPMSEVTVKKLPLSSMESGLPS